MLDLLGDEVRPDINRSRLGYPKQPGSGPKAETCGTCQHYTRVGWHGKKYLKCGLMRAIWSHGAGTDIKKKSPACSSFEGINNDGS